MLLNEIANEVGMTKRAIKYYEEKGLLSVNKSNNGYRDYSQNDVDTLKRISVYRKLGVSVKDIKSLLERLKEFDTKEIIKLALIGGLDCFLVGVGCYYMNLPFLMESFVLFLIVLCGYMIHFYIGYYNGAGYQKAYYFLCGAVYLFMSLSLIFRLIRL